MGVSINTQAFIFIACAFCGLVSGVLFDVFRVARRVVRTSNIVAMAEDIAYWLIVVIVFFIFMQNVSSGELRLFELIALFLGFVFYFVVLSPCVIKTSVVIITFLGKVLSVVIKIVLYPVVLIFKIIKKPLFIVWNIGKKKSNKIKQKIVQSLLNINSFFKRI
ncbi:MAG: hypothetical protein GX800_03235 [Clostridiaceae bacterium]|nr:hypothetical protein [Clostridiaceae bacterium]